MTQSFHAYPSILIYIPFYDCLNLDFIAKKGYKTMAALIKENI